MFMRDFNQYCERTPGTIDDFVSFLEDRWKGKPVGEVVLDVSWQLYELQICMEGIIEDLEYISGEENG